MNTHASRRLAAALAVFAVLALAACSSSGNGKDASAPGASPGPTTPTSTSGSPGLTGSLTSSPPVTGKPSPTPAVKQLIHYSVAATRTCSWSTTKAGHLVISLGFRITATGKNPPTNVPFTITDGTVTATAYEPVGAPFQAVLDSGKPAADNPWVGKIITAKVTVNGGQPNAVHASLTMNGPVPKIPNGDTYCPAD